MSPRTRLRLARTWVGLTRVATAVMVIMAVAGIASAAAFIGWMFYDDWRTSTAALFLAPFAVAVPFVLYAAVAVGIESASDAAKRVLDEHRRAGR